VNPLSPLSLSGSTPLHELALEPEPRGSLTLFSVMIFKSSVSELVTMLEEDRKVEEAEETSVKGFVTTSLPLILILSFLLIKPPCVGGGTEHSTATRRASQFNLAREEGESSGRKDSKLRRTTENPFCSHMVMGESFCPDKQYM
jgi:hypothetical protein